MILTALAALSLLRTVEHINKPAGESLLAGPTGKEIDAVKELQKRVAPIMWNEHAKGASTMLRFLRFKKMDVNAAEKAIRATVKWREDIGMNKIRHEKPDPDMLKRFYFNQSGVARNGDPVLVVPYGDWDMRKYAEEVGDQLKFDKHQGQMWDKGLWAVEQEEMRRIRKRIPSKEPLEYIIVCDMGKLRYSQLASYKSMQYILSMVYNFENNFPEIVRKALMLNGDWIFSMLLDLIRPFMRGSIEKLKPYPKDRSKWEKIVRRHVDPIHLPYRYGGYSPAERKKLKLPPSDDCC